MGITAAVTCFSVITTQSALSSPLSPHLLTPGDFSATLTVVRASTVMVRLGKRSSADSDASLSAFSVPETHKGQWTFNFFVTQWLSWWQNILCIHGYDSVFNCALLIKYLRIVRIKCSPLHLKAIQFLCRNSPFYIFKLGNTVLYLDPYRAIFSYYICIYICRVISIMNNFIEMCQRIC